MTKPNDALPTKIAQDLLQHIISAEFRPGTLLPSERDLQEEYGVSRTVIREAIKLLASRKLVQVRRGQGAVVASDFNEPVIDALMLAFHQSQIHTGDVFAIRSLLEPQSAALAAQNATVTQIRRLTEIAKKFDEFTYEGDEQKIRQDAKRWGKLDRDFHQLLAEASQNAVLGILISVIVGIIWNSISSKISTPPPEAFRTAAQQHQAIAHAVAERDAVTAQRMMSEHIETSLRNVAEPEDRVQIQFGSLL